MVGDIRISECHSLGEIYIYDLSETRMGHISKLTPAILKKSEIVATVRQEKSTTHAKWHISRLNPGLDDFAMTLRAPADLIMQSNYSPLISR